MAQPRMEITPHTAIGVSLALLGVVLTLDNLGFVEAGTVIRFWPLIPMLVGAAYIVQGREAREWAIGTAWLAGGTAFLLKNLGVFPFRLTDFLPLLLVALGLKVIFQRQGRGDGTGQAGPRPCLARRRPSPTGEATFAPRSRGQAVLRRHQGTLPRQPGGGCWRPVVGNRGSPQARPDHPPVRDPVGRIDGARSGVARRGVGGDGGCDLDLREAVPAIDPIAIQVFAMWGGIDIRIPPGWSVEIEARPILGGVVDNTQAPALPSHRVICAAWRSWAASRSRTDPGRAPPATVHPILARRDLTIAYAVLWLVLGAALAWSSACAGAVRRHRPARPGLRVHLPHAVGTCASASRCGRDRCGGRRWSICSRPSSASLWVLLVHVVLAWSAARRRARGRSSSSNRPSSRARCRYSSCRRCCTTWRSPWTRRAWRRRGRRRRSRWRRRPSWALRAQLTPHFLFNSLNSISALTSADPPAARRMCLLLGDFLRGTLHLSSLERIPLGQELALVDQFLAIEQVRFGERLQLERAIAPETLAIAIPPLIVQPLAENALRHGVAQRLEGGTVSIEARIEGDELIVTIENPRRAPKPRTGRPAVGLAAAGSKQHGRGASCASAAMPSGSAPRSGCRRPASRERKSETNLRTSSSTTSHWRRCCASTCPGCRASRSSPSAPTASRR